MSTDEHSVPTLIPVLDAASAKRAGHPAIRRVLRWFSHILLALGVLAFVWTFVIWKWGDPVTALYTRYEQHQLAKQYVKRVARVEKTLPKVAPTISIPAEERQIAKEAATYRADSKTGEAIGRLTIKRLHLNMILINGTDEGSLMRGPGRDQRTYMPGQHQLVYIAGHRTTYLAPFADINDMKNGDLVTVSVPYGTFTYRVYNSVIVPATDVARLKTFGKDVVILQACHPRFFATHRYLVYARLVHVTPTRGRPYELS
jgi:sortase A